MIADILPAKHSEWCLSAPRNSLPGAQNEVGDILGDLVQGCTSSRYPWFALVSLGVYHQTGQSPECVQWWLSRNAMVGKVFLMCGIILSSMLPCMKSSKCARFVNPFTQISLTHDKGDNSANLIPFQRSKDSPNRRPSCLTKVGLVSDKYTLAMQSGRSKHKLKDT